MGDNKPKTNGNVYIINPGIQKVSTDTSNIPVKNLHDQDRETFINILKSLDFDSYKAIRGESRSGRYKQSKTNFQNVFWNFKELRKLSLHLTKLMSTLDSKSY